MKADDKSTANLYLRRLFLAALGGDEKAAAELHSFVLVAIEQLQIVDLELPQLLEATKRRAVKWPGFYSPIDGVRVYEKQFTGETGKDSQLKSSGKQVDPELPASRAAWNILATINSFKWRSGRKVVGMAERFQPVFKLSKGLPPLTRKTFPQWKNVVDAAFIAEFGNDFHQHQLFKSYKPIGEKRGANEQKKDGGLVRSSIKKAVFQSVRLLLS